MAKQKATVDPELERLREENEELRSRLEQIAEIAAGIGGGDDEDELDDEEEDETDEEEEEEEEEEA